MTLKNSRRDNELEKFKDKYDTYDISVTSTSATTSLSGTKADVVKDILLQNVGAQSVFFQLVNATTTITATSGSRFHFGGGEMTEGVDAGQRLMAEARPRRDERSAKRRSPYKLVPRQPLPGHPAPGRGSELTSEQSRPADESMDEPAGVSPVRVAVARKGRRDRSILKPGGHRERGNALRSFVLARQKKPSR